MLSSVLQSKEFRQCQEPLLEIPRPSRSELFLAEVLRGHAFFIITSDQNNLAATKSNHDSHGKLSIDIQELIFPLRVDRKEKSH